MGLAEIAALVLGGGLIQAAIAYPHFAQTQRGWKIGSWASNDWFLMYYAFGAFAFLGGMFALWRWIGLLLAWPIAMGLGALSLFALRQRIQTFALAGPILCNVWFWAG